MKKKRFKHLIRRIDLSRFPLRMTPNCLVIDDKSVEIWICCSLKDRDTGGYISVIFKDLVERPNNEDRLFEQVLKLAREVVVHELDECFRVDGKIFKDPHAIVIDETSTGARR